MDISQTLSLREISFNFNVPNSCLINFNLILMSPIRTLKEMTIV